MAGIAGELEFFGLAVLRGILTLAIYDALRILRRVAPHADWAVALEDLLYWILTALLIFQLLYRENDGAVRGYALLAVALGMLLYHRIVSGWLVEQVSGLLSAVLGILLKPVRMLLRRLAGFVRMCAHYHKNKLKKKWKEFIMILFS